MTETLIHTTSFGKLSIESRNGDPTFTVAPITRLCPTFYAA